MVSIIMCERGLLVDKFANPIPASRWEGASVGVHYPSTTVVSLIAPEEVTSGSDFEARLAVDKVEDFDSFQVDLVYDPNVFELKVVGPGSIGGVEVPTRWSLIPPTTQGRVRILGNVPGVPGISGSGYLAEITFHAK